MKNSLLLILLEPSICCQEKETDVYIREQQDEELDEEMRWRFNRK